MYQGKYYKCKRQRRFAKPFVVLVSTLVLLVGMVGGSVAYLFATDTPIENTFTKGFVSCEVVETFHEKTKKDVKIKNTGNTDAYIRAMVVVTWKDANGNVYGGAQPVAETDYQITFNESGWTKEGNNWYCNACVAEGGLTAPLIVTCSEVTEKRPSEEYGLSVEIIADAIQAGPDTSVVQNAWGYVPGTN